MQKISKRTQYCELSRTIAIGTDFRPINDKEGELVITRFRPSTGDSKDIALIVTPYSSDEYAYFSWDAKNGLLVAGAEKVVLIEDDLMEVRSTIHFEIGECETMSVPSVILFGETLILSSESRMFGILPNLTIGWCWSTRVLLSGWSQIAGPATQQGSKIIVPIRTQSRDVEAIINLGDGSSKLQSP